MDNPYYRHPNLSVLESEVLSEYAKLANHLRTITRLLAQQSDSALLANLRTLEKKMGLVLTLVRAFHTRSFTHLTYPSSKPPFGASSTNNQMCNIVYCSIYSFEITRSIVFDPKPPSLKMPEIHTLAQTPITCHSFNADRSRWVFFLLLSVRVAHW